jgi:hypothetical protein
MDGVLFGAVAAALVEVVDGLRAVRFCRTDGAARGVLSGNSHSAISMMEPSTGAFGIFLNMSVSRSRTADFTHE